MGEAERVLAEARKTLEDSSRCGICLEVYCAPHRTGCGHIFCGVCLAGWIERNRTCPSCREDLHVVQPDLGVGNVVEGLALVLLDRKGKEERKARSRQWEEQRLDVYRRWSQITPFPILGHAFRRPPNHERMAQPPPPPPPIYGTPILGRMNGANGQFSEGGSVGHDGMSDLDITSSEGSLPPRSFTIDDEYVENVIESVVESEEVVSSPPSFRTHLPPYIGVLGIPSIDRVASSMEPVQAGVGASHIFHAQQEPRISLDLSYASVSDPVFDPTPPLLSIYGHVPRVVSVEPEQHAPVVPDLPSQPDVLDMMQSLSTDGLPCSVGGDPLVVGWSRVSNHQGGAEPGESPAEPIDLVSESEGEEGLDDRASRVALQSLQYSIAFARDHFEQVSRILENGSGHRSENQGDGVQSYSVYGPLADGHPLLGSSSDGVEYGEEVASDGFDSEEDLDGDEMDFSDDEVEDDVSDDESAENGAQVENGESRVSEAPVWRILHRWP
ncbi:hypothetical protein BSKO_12999 [Bryopsis sp. KO-2023]|nr:hypothetical protein BSKO_12999 [Bryopsis sp. KO-2023]